MIRFFALAKADWQLFIIIESNKALEIEKVCIRRNHRKKKTFDWFRKKNKYEK